MKLILPRILLLSLAGGIGTAAFAESDIPVEYFQPHNNRLSVGLRIRGGVSAKFGNLGTVPAINQILDKTTSGVTRVYDNGSVNADSSTARTEESTSVTNADGSVTTTQIPPGSDSSVVNISPTGPGGSAGKAGYYPVTGTDAAGATVVNGSHLSYIPGQTRSWSVATPGQISSDGQSVTLSNYSATSEGGTAQANGSSGGGVEIELEHSFGNISKRVEWGLSFSMGVSDINAKTRGRVVSTLHTQSDVYKINAGPNGSLDPNQAYGGPTFIPYPNGTDSTGAPLDTSSTPGGIGAGGTETTIPLNDTPSSSLPDKTQAGKALIDGFWQIKGAYYIFKFGPEVRIQFTDKIAVSFGGGAAAAYVGTKYRVDESILLPDTPTPVRFQSESEDQKKLIPGFYGTLNAEYWVTERTGFYAGVTYEKAGNYTQSFLGRTAQIDIASGAGFRLGLVTRF